MTAQNILLSLSYLLTWKHRYHEENFFCLALAKHIMEDMCKEWDFFTLRNTQKKTNEFVRKTLYLLTCRLWWLIQFWHKLRACRCTKLARFLVCVCVCLYTVCFVREEKSIDSLLQLRSRCFPFWLPMSSLLSNSTVI